MTKLIRFILAMAIAVSLTGCATRLIDFTMISTKNIDWTHAANFQRGKDRVQGTDEVSIIIFIPTGVPNMKEAIDRAIEKIPGAVALVDGVVTQKSWYIPYIFGKFSYIIEGTPLIDPSLAAGKLKTNFIVSRLDQSGAVKEFRYVDEKEYAALKNHYIHQGHAIDQGQ